MNGVTQILSAIGRGERNAADELLPLVYDELRKLASRKLAHEKHGSIFQPTALVHDAYIRLVDAAKVPTWDGRAHFFAAAAEAMRRILIEKARERKRLKRGGDRRRVSLCEVELSSTTSADDLLDFDAALEKLHGEDPIAAQLVKLRCFGGLSMEQAAEMMGMSRSSAYEQWAYARAWLHCQLRGRDESSS